MSDGETGLSTRFPTDWSTITVGEAFEMQLGKMLSKASKIGKTPKPYLANKNVQWDRVDFSNLETMDFTEAEREKFALLPGDLLVCEGGEIGRTAMWHGEMPNCFFQKAMHRLRPRTNDVLPEYMLRYMRLAATNGWLVDFMSQSSIAHLTREQFARVPVCVPPLPQQRKIARILTTVDNLIEKTEALIAKYQAIKQGMMNDLFTRGVDEHGHLRPPYEEAPELYKQSELGWIPNEWGCHSFGEFIVAGPQNGLYKPNSSYSADGSPIVRIDGFYDGKLCDITSFRRLHLTQVELAVYTLEVNDILVNRVNSIDYVGKSSIVPELQEATVFESNIMRLRVNRERLLPELAIRLLCNFTTQSQLRQFAKSAVAQASINQSDIRQCVVAVPQLKEQASLVEICRVLDRQVECETIYLARLLFQKSGLMQDLLTGKVRVAVDEAYEVAAHA